MAREYDLYRHLHELQPPPHFPEPYQLPPPPHCRPGPSTSSIPSYELTASSAAAGAGGGEDGAALPHQHHDPRKRKSPNESAVEETGLSELTVLMPRKRKSSYCSSSAGGRSTLGDGDDDSRSVRTLPDKKQNHSEIEKRRRDKMNTYIAELGAMVPMCRAMARKLDKLTVLRLAAAHVRSVRGALAACPLTAPPWPAYLSQREVNALVLQAAGDAFLLVVGCDRGRLLYVSASVSLMLQYNQSELVGQSLFDLVHPKDVAKVKEQLSSSDLSPRERLIDAKTMLPVKTDVVSGATRLCPGARRSFFCRVRCRPRALATACAEPPADDVKEETADPPATKPRKKQTIERKYCVIQCTGYLKSWAGAGEDGGEDSGEEGSGSASCLVAVARKLPASSEERGEVQTRRLQYVSRHTVDGKFLFVDGRVTPALGFLPQELLGTSLYEYVAGAELGGVAKAHRAALQKAPEPAHTPPYSFRKKDGTYARVHTHFKHFHNPWTKDAECLVANNTLLPAEPAAEQPPLPEQFKQGASEAGAETPAPATLSEAEGEVQRLIDSQMESHKIGSAIADEALRQASPNETEFSPELPSLPPDLLHPSAFSHLDSILSGVDEALTPVVIQIPPSPPSEVRNNVALSSAAPACSPPPAEAPEGAPQAAEVTEPPSPPLSLDGNGEAAMAVIMNLLEADAGLGGPVNLAGLPWLLP